MSSFRAVCTFVLLSHYLELLNALQCCHNKSKRLHGVIQCVVLRSVPYFLDQTPPSNSRHTQIVAASFTYPCFIVAALELSPHVLIRIHLPRPSTGGVLTSERRYCTCVIGPCLLERNLTKADGGKQAQTVAALE